MRVEYEQIFPIGERAILIQFELKIQEKTLNQVLLAKQILLNRYVKLKVEIITTYNSLLIFYLHTIEDVYSEILAIKEVLGRTNIGKKSDRKIFRIPVCYAPSFGSDLEYLSHEKNLPVEEIIRLHSEPIYTVYFIGFLPGFLYLGGLNDLVNFPRKNQPRFEVLKGAVGIAGNQTGIYPMNSPGGWQIIGNSPLSFFNKKDDPPSHFSAGDKLKFYPISEEEYIDINAEVESGNFQLKSEIYESGN